MGRDRRCKQFRPRREVLRTRWLNTYTHTYTYIYFNADTQCNSQRNTDAFDYAQSNTQAASDPAPASDAAVTLREMLKKFLQLSRRGVKGFQGGYFLVTSFGAKSDSVILVVIRCNGVPFAAVDLQRRSCKALA